jgi:transposase InsO family protein
MEAAHMDIMEMAKQIGQAGKQHNKELFGELLDRMYEWKDNLQRLAGRQIGLYKQRPVHGVQDDQSEWTLPDLNEAGTPQSDPWSDNRTTEPARRLQEAFDENLLDPALRQLSHEPYFRQPGNEEDQMSLIDDSAVRGSSPPASEITAITGYQVRCVMEVASMAVTTTQEEEWEALNEEWYGDLLRYCKDNNLPPDWSSSQRNKFTRWAKGFRFSPSKGRLERLKADRWLPCVSPKDVPRILQSTHDKGGHFSSEVLAKKLGDRVFWPTMTRDVREFVLSCTRCAIWAQRQRTQPLTSLDALYPFEMVQADLMGPFPDTEKGHKYLLTATCCFTGFTVVEPLPNKEARTVQGALERIFSTFCDPIVLYVDAGAEFATTELEDTLRSRGVVLKHAPAAAHRVTGAIENVNRIIRRCLEKVSPIYKRSSGTLFTSFKDWDVAVKQCVQAANERYMPKLGYAPSEVLLGSLPGQLRDMELSYPSDRRLQVVNLAQACGPKDIPEGDLYQACFELAMDRQEIQEQLQSNRVTERAKREAAYNKGVNPRPVHIGDLVFTRTRAESLNNREAPWVGPYRVIAYSGEHNRSCVLESVDGTRRLNYPRHPADLRVFYPRPTRLRVEGMHRQEEPALIVEGD